MTGYRLTPAAELDLDEIWDYTAERWSAEQAESYLSVIRDACEGLANGLRRGRSIDEIRTGYWKLSVGSHFLFYRFGESGAGEIMRILHQRMDVSRHLGR
ncbi:MAG TPA: type II toxin-antitoxin system RelE/ParE family toxin [Afifellaceae bacterium]|nr:type II toxin-antitoxin system RelE/ParE family toxin [Afifellaceae bacterium]